jgi:ATP-dependent DNA helicase RecG
MLTHTAIKETLRGRKFGKSWDDIIVEDATIKDIDETAGDRFIRKALDSKRIPADVANDGIESMLRNLHLVNEKGKFKTAALLLFGKDPLKYFTHAYFKIGRFGESHSDLKFQDVVQGNILDMADKVMEILRSKYLTSPNQISRLATH